MLISLEEMKRALNVTWDDQYTNDRIIDTYGAAMALVQDYAGPEVELKSDEMAKQLLKDCMRYIWNDCLDEFERRFSPHIIALRNRYKVLGYVQREAEIREGEEDTVSDL